MKRHATACVLASALFLSLVPASSYAADKLNDAQIAHIAYTAGDIDIKAAEIALTHAKSAAVK